MWLLKKHWQKWGDWVRLIDADELKEVAHEMIQEDPEAFNGGYSYYAVTVGEIDEAPTIEAVPVVHGEWVNGKCSNCGEYIPTDTRIDFVDEEDCVFCYSCGADMRKKV